MMGGEGSEDLANVLSSDSVQTLATTPNSPRLHGISIPGFENYSQESLIFSNVSVEGDSKGKSKKRIKIEVDKNVKSGGKSPFIVKLVPKSRGKRICFYVSLILLILLIILLPVLFEIIIPNFAQNELDKSIFEIENFTISNPLKDSFELEIFGKITETGPFDIDIGSFDVDLIFEGKAFGRMKMPKMSTSLDAKGGNEGKRCISIMGLQEKVEILDENVFVEFCRKTVSETLLTLQMETTESLSISIPLMFHHAVGGLKMRKKVTVAGMQGLNQLKLTSINLPSDDPSKGIELDVISEIFNPSKIQMSVGHGIKMNVFVSLPYHSMELSPLHAAELTVVSDDVLIVKPGWNEWRLKGYILPLLNMNGITDPRMDYFFTEFVSGRGLNSRVECSYTHVKDDLGNDLSVPWLNSTIKSLVMDSVWMPGLEREKRQKLITMISSESLALNFREDALPTDLKVDCSSSLMIGMTMPFPNIKMEIVSASLKNELTTLNSEISFALLHSNGWQSSISLNSSHTFIPVMKGTLSINHGEEANDGNQNRNENMAEKRAESGIGGKFSIRVETAVGLVEISEIDMPQGLIFGLEGMNSFEDSEPFVKTLVMSEKTTKDHLIIDMDVEMVNPSSTSVLGIGDVVFSLGFDGEMIGDLTIVDFNLIPGYQVVKARSNMTKIVSEHSKAFFTHFMQGTKTRFTLMGRPDSSPKTLMSGSLVGIMLSAVLPGVKEDLVEQAYVLGWPNRELEVGIQTFMIMRNPFDLPIKIYSLNNITIATDDLLPKEKHLVDQIDNLKANASSDENISGFVIGSVNQRFPNPLTIGPVDSGTLAVKLDLKFPPPSIVAKIISRIGKSPLLRIAAFGRLTCSLGDYEIHDVSYLVRQVPVNLIRQ